MLLEQPDAVESSDEDDNFDSYSYPATAQPKAQKVPKVTLEADTIIVSCGMLTFEDSSFANGSSNEFRNHIGSRKVEVAHFEKHPEDSKVFLRSFKKNFPELCKDRQIIVVDGTRFSDPHHDKRLRNHLGTHHVTFKKLSESKEFDVVNAPLRRLRSDQKNLVVNVCKLLGVYWCDLYK